jgi:3-phosphoshikimate 1-carboxyvinyltransferase
MTNDKLRIQPVNKITGEIVVPPDKSISHRAVMFGSIADGVTTVKNFLMAEDCMRTVEAFRAMAVKIDVVPRIFSGSNLGGHYVEIKGAGLRGLKEPKAPLYCGNSGTTMRLLSGILAGQDFQATLTGDESLSNRPMKRISEPLKAMGAKVKGEHPPLVIRGGRLKAIDYKMPVASAQVKSCVLLAGLYADGTTSVAEPMPSRDHTERMLALFGVKVSRKEGKVSVKGGQRLKAADIEVPADISSAAFFIVAALIAENSRLRIKAVGINPTRTGMLDILKKMGANIRVQGAGFRVQGEAEPAADLIVESSSLKAVTIKGGVIPRAIDELPVIMVAATQAKGTTKILGAKELRVKETDRIKSMSEGLNKMGADIKVKGDDIYIKGPTRLKGAALKSFGDHRTAMSFAVAGLVAKGQTVIEDTSCILTSFPNFKDILSVISQ